MHILQPKHIRLSEEQAQEVLDKLNIATNQLPKILSSDAALPEERNSFRPDRLEDQPVRTRRAPHGPGRFLRSQG